ncbi:unnamed protein product, partial [Staurois parvus]
MGPRTTSHAAARPVICHGPLLPASSCCCQVQSVSWVPLYGLPLLLSLSPHSAMCHFQGLLTLLVVSIFVIGCCMASIAAASTATLWLPHSGFGPVTAQMSEVCGDSKIDGTHLHVILTDSIVSLPQQTPRAFKLKVQCSALIL